MNISFLKEKREAERLTQAEVAKALDMQPQSWYKIEKGVNNLNPAHFPAVSRLLHVTIDELKQYAYAVKMAKQENTLDRIGWVTSLPEEDYNNIVNAYESRELDPGCILNGENAVPVTYVPLVSEAAAASCAPGVCMPLIDCVSAYSEEKVPFESARDGDFSIRVVGTSMQPWYPPGTLLLCRPEQRITNGKRVIAVTDDGEIIFKVFARGKKSIHLFSIDGSGQDFEFPLSGKGLRYICRVISAQRSEDDVDKAMAEAGVHHGWEDKLREAEK